MFSHIIAVGVIILVSALFAQAQYCYWHAKCYKILMMESSERARSKATTLRKEQDSPYENEVGLRGTGYIQGNAAFTFTRNFVFLVDGSTFICAAFRAPRSANVVATFGHSGVQKFVLEQSLSSKKDVRVRLMFPTTDARCYSEALPRHPGVSRQWDQY